MRTVSGLCVVILSCLTLLACDSPTGPSFELNEEFTLAPGGSARIADSSSRIVFEGVTGDSRCPADAFCIQGGDAIVHIQVVSPGVIPSTYELHTGDLQPVTHAGWTISLVQLAPYPFSTRTIGPDEYRATMVVR